MKIAIASDHAAFKLKEYISEYLRKNGNEVTDHGCHGYESVNYPDYARKVAVSIQSGEAEIGILCCGTGIGMSIAANKFRGIRAALIHDATTARLARQHNKANVACLGGRLIAPELACEIVEVFIKTEFEERHSARIDLIEEIEREQDIQSRT